LAAASFQQLVVAPPPFYANSPTFFTIGVAARPLPLFARDDEWKQHPPFFLSLWTLWTEDENCLETFSPLPFAIPDNGGLMDPSHFPVPYNTTRSLTSTSVPCLSAVGKSPSFFFLKVFCFSPFSSLSTALRQLVNLLPPFHLLMQEERYVRPPFLLSPTRRQPYWSAGDFFPPALRPRIIDHDGRPPLKVSFFSHANKRSAATSFFSPM